MNIKTGRSQNGFTIVELLIVIVVIAILATITVVTYGGIQARARDTIRINDLKTVQKIVEMYRTTYGTYPLSATGSGAWAGNCTSYGSANPYIIGVTEFSPRLPLEPRNGTVTVTGSNCYLYRSDGNDYMVIAHNTMESICGGDPGNACNSEDIRALDRVNYTQLTIAIYSPGARLW